VDWVIKRKGTRPFREKIKVVAKATAVVLDVAKVGRRSHRVSLIN
jgi:hypothetical protein